MHRNKEYRYSIIALACASRLGGTVTPIALAVDPVLASSNPLSTRHQWFACTRLSQSYLPKSRSNFSATVTTIAFDDSSLRWLEINT
jgi:hypothetical protein